MGSVATSRWYGAAVLGLLVLAGSAGAQATPGVYGKLVIQDGSPAPDGLIIQCTLGGKTAEALTVQGRFEVDLPPTGGPATVAIKTCAGASLGTGQVALALPDDTTRSGPGDLGTLNPINMTMPAKKPSMLVLRGKLTSTSNQPAPDGTEISLGLERAMLFDSAKTKGGEYSIVLVDPANKSGGFAPGDELGCLLRTADGKTLKPVPAKYRLSLGDVANGGVCREVNFMFEPEAAGMPKPPDPPAIKEDIAFGSGTKTEGALQGNVYFLPVGTPKLPDFTPLKPVAMIFAKELNITPRTFSSGFPGIDNRFEWFGIRYQGSFTAAAPGAYTWRLLSDDGSKLFVDDALVVDNDGTHPPSARTGRSTLAAGTHMIRVEYFQGPRFQIALQLFVTPPGKTEQLWGPSI